jgi:hypothetical protein
MITGVARFVFDRLPLATSHIPVRFDDWTCVNGLDGKAPHLARLTGLTGLTSVLTYVEKETEQRWRGASYVCDTISHTLIPPLG